ncbi:MAG: hypothetical protein AVDCRST_MAG26-4661 [uncultured Chloroflexia bacterium]|uniref:Uncharacterized protein n=1 Tax=uncultured Chloroflexia bacterium TaxID=1672391 RepID=A0A6J4K966_9CHLR|nr:MAG: hypothetical protein AVDCRST_MAG26-4661 [uncultured Chloroflexia bacterium]
MPVQDQGPTAEAYDESYFTTLYGTAAAQTPADKLRDWLVRRAVQSHANGGRLLDIGCGFGFLLELFDDRWERFGTDISAHAVTVAARRLPEARLAVADVQDGIPFQGLFDAIVAVNVMEHLPDPGTAARAIAAHLSPGGIFVAHLPTISSPLAAWFYARSYARDETHVYRPSGEAFNQMVETAGFWTLHAAYFPFQPAALWRRLRPHPSYLAVFARV